MPNFWEAYYWRRSSTQGAKDLFMKLTPLVYASLLFGWDTICAAKGFKLGLFGLCQRICEYTLQPCQPHRKPCLVAEHHCTVEVRLIFWPEKTQLLLVWNSGGQTTARGQKSAHQEIFKCPLNFFEKLHLLNSNENSAILDKKYTK